MAIGAVVIVVIGLFTLQALSVRSSLSEAAGEADLLQSQIVAGDVNGARATLIRLQDAAAKAHDKSDGVLWKTSSKIPWIGRNVDAVRTVAGELDAVAQDAVPPIVDLAGELSAKTFNPRDGRIDLAAVGKAAPGLSESAKALQSAQARLSEIDAPGLLAPLRAPVATAQNKVDAAASTARQADLAAQLLPEMLGGKGTRRYLLMVQNNAEARSGGGIVGSISVITAKNGTLKLGDQGNGSDLDGSGPVVKLTDEEKSVFPSTMATDLRNVTMTPDFPRSAAIARKLFARGSDTKIDGVISIDPVALGYLLAGIGPVELTDQVTIDQNNAVSTLQHLIYQVLDFEQQDEFFELTTRKVFNRLVSGKGDPVLVLRSFVRSVAENRISVWSADKATQTKIATTDLAGILAGGESEVSDLGIYVSDSAAGKMEYFLTTQTAAVPSGCLDGRQQVYTMSAGLTSSAPTDVKTLTNYVAGNGKYVKRGSMRLNVRLIGPVGGHFTSVRLNDRPLTISSSTLKGRPVTRAEVVLAPGASATLTANVTGAKGQDGGAILSSTPGIDSKPNEVNVVSPCD